jgi:hypothetical protein
MLKPAKASHDEIAASVAIKYDIGLRSSMFTSVDNQGHWKSGRERQSSVRLAIYRPDRFTVSRARTCTHGSRHLISHAKPETTLSELTDSAWYVVITEPSLSD